ncbi:MAG TPA: hypothetical protein VM680_19080 [Verrucomicrobiae bacterium]|nr:hypothetical protein [Verrucomicrobiae bacterium]
MKTTLIKTLPLALALAGAISTFAADELTAVETKKTTLAAKIDETKLSPASLKAAHLLQSGMDEKVVVAYVKNNPSAAAPSAEELVYLHQLGVSESGADRAAHRDAAGRNHRKGGCSLSRGRAD